MSKESSNSGIGILGLLGVAFVVLKLCKVIDWSWWWVTCPFWGGLALILIMLIVAILLTLISTNKNSKRDDGYIAKKSSFQIRLEEMAKQRESLKK